MPETLPQWLWFAFFTGGALGGWLAGALAVWWAVETFEVHRFLRRLEKK